MEDQWRLRALVAAKAAGPSVALLETGSLHQIRRDLSRLHLGHIPGHHLAAPDVDHQIEVQPHTPHRGRQKADVPRPDRIGAIRSQPRHGARFLRQPRTPAAVALPCLVQHPIETALGTDIQPLISQGRHDLPQWQRCEFRLVAGEQNPLALLLAQAESDMAGAAFTAILAVPIITKGLPPAFEGAQADADLTAGTHQVGASSIRLADQLDHLPPVRAVRQPSASSEQKASHFFAAPAMPLLPPGPSPCAAALS